MVPIQSAVDVDEDVDEDEDGEVDVVVRVATSRSPGCHHHHHREGLGGTENVDGGEGRKVAYIAAAVVVVVAIGEDNLQAGRRYLHQ